MQHLSILCTARGSDRRRRQGLPHCPNKHSEQGAQYPREVPKAKSSLSTATRNSQAAERNADAPWPWLLVKDLSHPCELQDSFGKLQDNLVCSSDKSNTQYHRRQQHMARNDGPLASQLKPCLISQMTAVKEAGRYKLGQLGGQPDSGRLRGLKGGGVWPRTVAVRCSGL